MEKFLICIQTAVSDQNAKENRHLNVDDAIRHAQKMLADNPKYQSITICEAVKHVERATPPITVSDIR